MRTIAEMAGALTAAQVQGAPWQFSAAAYQAALGVHQPWIAEISPMQYAHMGKAQKAAYDKRRAGEWEASAAVKGEWRAAVVAAWREGRFDPQDAEVHPDAAQEVRWVQHADAKAAAAQERAGKDRANEITDAKQVKVGDQVWLVIQRAYAEVIKVSQRSVQVRTPYGPYKVPVSGRTPLMLRNDPRESKGENEMVSIRSLLEKIEMMTKTGIPLRVVNGGEDLSGAGKEPQEFSRIRGGDTEDARKFRAGTFDIETGPFATSIQDVRRRGIPVENDFRSKQHTKRMNKWILQNIDEIKKMENLMQLMRAFDENGIRYEFRDSTWD